MLRKMRLLVSDFRRWLAFNLRYLGKPRWDTGISPPELLAFIAAHPPGRALDMGCGTGVNVETLARAGWQVTGVDFALRALTAARRRLKRAGLRADLRYGDVTDLRDLSGPFDLIFDLGCFFSLPDEARAAYRLNLHRLLASQGQVLLYAYLNEMPAGFGMPEAEVDRLGREFALVSRVDGHDARGLISTWLTLRSLE